MQDVDLERIQSRRGKWRREDKKWQEFTQFLTGSHKEFTELSCLYVLDTRAVWVFPSIGSKILVTKSYNDLYTHIQLHLPLNTTSGNPIRWQPLAKAGVLLTGQSGIGMSFVQFLLHDTHQYIQGKVFFSGSWLFACSRITLMSP